MASSVAQPRESVHRTVLLNETIEGLDLHEGSVVIDCTFGGGGHSRQICRRYPDVKILALDQDKSVWDRWLESRSPGEKCDITFANLNFRNLDQLKNADRVDGIIFDLGLSSDQLENSGRGFSFLKDESLLMQMKNTEKENSTDEDLSAKEIVNTWDEKNLADIIYGYGEEKFSRRIAKAIVEAREKKEIETTFDLVKIIESAVPGAYRRGRLHFATRTFQALRIATNDELRSLEEGLKQGFEILKEGGRMSVISFHSLEDRIVKRFFREKVKEGKAILIHKKPITPGEEELKNNPRSRSAKLRVIEKSKTIN